MKTKWIINKISGKSASDDQFLQHLRKFLSKAPTKLQQMMLITKNVIEYHYFGNHNLPHPLFHIPKHVSIESTEAWKSWKHYVFCINIIIRCETDSAAGFNVYLEIKMYTSSMDK